MQHGADLILRIIANIIDDPRFCRQKSVVWQQLWDAVRNVAADFAQAAADLGLESSKIFHYSNSKTTSHRIQFKSFHQPLH